MIMFIIVVDRRIFRLLHASMGQLLQVQSKRDKNISSNRNNDPNSRPNSQLREVVDPLVDPYSAEH
jgi:hypothetical protein